MARILGNTMRPSAAQDDGQPINNLPGLYPTEDWDVYYWDVQPSGELRSRQAVIQLPLGYAAVCTPIQIGQPGCVHKVRRWGVQLYTRILQDMGFDPAQYLSQDGVPTPGGDEAEMISILIHATHFELPANFVIASEQHPLLLFDPQGLLKGSYTRWHTQLGALAFLVTEGTVSGTFGRLLEENPSLYQEALDYMLQAARRKDE